MNLAEWQNDRLATIHRGRIDYGHGRDDVTVVAYHFWNEDGFERAFRRVECAIRETWLHCGMMKTVVVVNRAMPCIAAFADAFPAVSVQVEPSLAPGRIFTMSADMNGRLFSRFGSEYCLVVQNDGFPLRGGLDEFVGRFDFIGAPYVRNTWWKQIVAKLLNCQVQNGGFSLRSRAICEHAARLWNARYSALGEFADSSEDLFYTKFLPLREHAYRRRFRLAAFADSLAFSYDAAMPIPPPEKIPFGFHGEKAFAAMHQRVACA